MYIYIFIFMFVCLYIYIHIYMYIHTYIGSTYADNEVGNNGRKEKKLDISKITTPQPILSHSEDDFLNDLLDVDDCGFPLDIVDASTTVLADDDEDFLDSLLDSYQGDESKNLDILTTTKQSKQAKIHRNSVAPVADDGDFLDSLLDSYQGKVDCKDENTLTTMKQSEQSKIDSSLMLLRDNASSESPYTGVLYTYIYMYIPLK
jgi:hypothetical protein